MDSIFVTAANLGGTVFTVTIFLWYLSKRDREAGVLSKTQADSNIVLAKALQELSTIVSHNTIETSKASSKSSRNTEAVEKNTKVVNKITDEIKNGSNK